SQHPATDGRSCEVRMDLRQLAAGRLVRRQIRELHVGMLRQQPYELAPHVARRTDDGDAQTTGLTHSAYSCIPCMNMSTEVMHRRGRPGSLSRISVTTYHP